MIITLAGSLSLGVTIGWIVRYFLARLTRFDVKALAAVVSILTGGGPLPIF